MAETKAAKKKASKKADSPEKVENKDLASEVESKDEQAPPEDKADSPEAGSPEADGAVGGGTDDAAGAEGTEERDVERIDSHTGQPAREEFHGPIYRDGVEVEPATDAEQPVADED